MSNLSIRLGDFPTRPGDLPQDVPLVELVKSYERHAWVLAADRSSMDGPLSDAQRAAHAIAALAYQHELAERALECRCLNALEALRCGASVDRVAAAMGLEVAELRALVTRWAEGQVRFAFLTPAERDAVVALLGGDRR